jgi:DeoR/GlpR family transcriptional regulator of sugar metabolism
MIMFSQERCQAILQLLAERQRLTTRDLEALYPASPATMRRDLAALESQGLLLRVHGGIMHPQALRTELSFETRSRQQADIKHALADLAAQQAPAEGCVFIDGGSTCLQVGLRLLTRPGLLVVTNSIPLVQAAHSAAARVVCLGGELKQVSMALVDQLALDWLARLHPDVAFMGATALDPQAGLFATNLQECAVKEAAIARSSRSVVVAAAAKCNLAAPINFAPWSAIQALVTDASLPREARRALKAQGVEVSLAELTD